MDCDSTEPSANLKCIIFTLAVAGFYWYLPRKNKWILLATLTLPYLVLAWYDFVYDCKRNMGPTYLAMFYGWAKPKESEQMTQYRNWCPNIRNRVFVVDIAILVLLIACVPSFLAWTPSYSSGSLNGHPS